MVVVFTWRFDFFNAGFAAIAIMVKAIVTVLIIPHSACIA